MIRRAFTLHELPSLVEAIFSSKGEADATRRLQGDDAQVFIDVIDEACSTLANPLIGADVDMFCRLGTG